MALQDWKNRVAAPTAELLKKRGFRKRGWRFSAERADAVMVVAFQSSQATDRNHLKVTVNLSIHLKGLQDTWSGFGGEHWAQRIGRFMAVPVDHWWTCSNDDEAKRAGEQIAALLEQAALPEMERLACAEALRDLWASGQSPGLTEKQRTNFLSMLTDKGS